MAATNRSNFPLSIVLFRAASWEFRGNKSPREEIKAIKGKGTEAMNHKCTPHTFLIPAEKTVQKDWEEA